MSTRARIGIVVAFVAALALVLLLRSDHAPREAATSSASRESSGPSVAVDPVPSVPASASAPPAPTSSSVESAEIQTLIGAGRIFGTATLPEGEAATSIMIDLHRVDIIDPVVSYEDTFVASQEVSAGEEFSFGRLPIGNYQLYASTASHTGQNSTRLGRSSPEQYLNVRLFPGGVISGRVVNVKGKSVSGANVFVGAYDVGGARREASRERALSSRVVTDAEGRFTMGRLRLSSNGEPGYKLGVAAEGYASLLSDYIPAGTMNAELVLTEGAVLSGTLIRSGTTDPVADETVLLESKFRFDRLLGTSDAEGFFFISEVPGGTHNAKLVDSEYVIVPEAGIFEIPEDARSAEVTLEVVAGGVVSGRVYDADTDKGIAGVELGVAVNEEYDGDHATTDAEGRYRIAGLAPRPIEIYLEKPRGYTFTEGAHLSPDVTPNSGTETPNIDFPLTRGMSISGVVVDERGEPIAGAQVSAIDVEGRYHDSAPTNSSGAFSLSGFPNGTIVHLYASKLGFARPPMSWETVSKYILDKTVSGITITLLSASKVSGFVVDADGRPVQGAELVVQTPTEPPIYVSGSSSNGSGSIVFEKIPPGEYAIGARNGWDSRISDEDTAVRVRVTRGEDLSGLRFVVPTVAKFGISGRVVDSRGNPVPQSTVNLLGIDHDYTPRTDATGAFEFTGLMEGAYDIRAHAHGFDSSDRVNVQTGTSDVVLTLKDFARIEGRVLNAATGGPVVVFAVDQKPFQDLEGRFVLDEVRERDRVFQVKAEGYAPASILAPPVAAGETYRGFVIRLEPGATLAGRVTDEVGKPIRGASVSLYPGNGDRYVHDPPGTDSGVDGTYRLQSLATGAQTLKVYQRDYAPISRPVTIVSGVENRVDVVLDSGVSIAGVVTLDGRPAPEANVSVKSADNSGGGSDADAGGRYRIDHLRPGNAKLSASSRGQDESHHAYMNVMIEEGRVTEVNIELGAGTASLEGTIFSRPGVPLRSRTGVSVRWDPEGAAYVRSGADGNFLIDHLPSGIVYLTVEAGNRTQKTVGVDLTAGQWTRQDIVLSEGAALNVEIDGTTGDESHPVGAVLYAGPIVFRVWSDEILNHPFRVGYGRVEGDRCEFHPLEPGTYTVVVWEADLVALELGKSEIRRWTSAIVEVSDEPEQTLRLGL